SLVESSEKKDPMGTKGIRITGKRISALIGIVMVFFLGCTHDASVKGFLESDSTGMEADYKSNLDKWTREARIYKGFDLELITTGIYLSPEFRNSYLNEYTRVFRSTDDAKKRLEQEQTQAAEKYDEFVIAAYTPEKQMNDFDKKKSSWKIYLVLDETLRLEPDKIEKRKMDPVLNYFFPFASPWKSFYTLRFPRHEPKEGSSPRTRGDEFRLLITGVRGTAEMKWRIR
ncbi:MAG: hypothetical protein AB1659_06610, partial [Thermodesulfobacteriota bacterium]